MALWKEIADSINKHDEQLKSLTRQECEAIIDALNLLVYADGTESVLERAELENLLHDLPWVMAEGDLAREYLQKSALCLSEATAKGKEAMARSAEGIAARLQGVKIRKRTLKMAAAIAHVDWHATDLERFALTSLAKAFEIPAPFAEAIIEEIEQDASRTLSILEEETEPELVPRAAEQTIRNVLSTSFLNGFFDDLFDDDELKHLDDAESMAFIDALSIALVADGYPEKEELAEFKAQLEKLPFSSEDIDRVQLRVESCLHTLRATPDHKLDDFIHNVASRISSQHLKERALDMAIHITHADLDITREEHRMLQRIARGFNIPSARLHDMVHGIMEDTEAGMLE